MKWEDAKEQADKMGGRFVRLQNKGDKVIGIVVGDPETRKSYYNEKTKQSETWTAEHEKQNLTASVKFLVNLFVVTERDVKIYEMNATSFRALVKAREKFGNDKVFEIERQGAKNDTKTYNACLPERDPTAEELAIVTALNKTGQYEKLKLNDLVKADDAEDEQTDLASHDKKGGAAAAPTVPQAAPATKPATSGTISKDEILTIGTRIKSLPDAPAKITAFLKHFGIQQVKEIPSARMVEVLAYLDHLEGKPAPSNGVAEADPFAV